MDNKITNIKDRFLQIAKYKGISYEIFCSRIGMSYSSFKGTAKNTPLNSDVIVSVLSMCPDIDLDWFLTGKGEMLKKNEIKSENFSKKNVRAKCEGKNVRAKDVLLGQNASPKQYDPVDGVMHDFAADQATDQEQIDSLDELVAGLQRACDQKNLLLAAKDELLAAKDQTIATQNNALKLLEGQINATTALIEELTKFLGNEAKKHPERADARDASDVAAL